MTAKLFEAGQLAAVLGFPKVHFVTPHSEYLSDAERRYLFVDESAILFTSAVADLLFQNALRYEHDGRAPCIACRKSPEWMPTPDFLAKVTHELGHIGTYFGRPEFSESNREKAMQLSWDAMRAESEQHDRTWLRSSVHLWHRATAVHGYEMPFSETINLEQYGYGRKDLPPLLAEASEREGEHIEAILASPYPGTSRRRTVSKRRPSLRSQVRMIGGHFVNCHPDGSYELLPDIDGKGARRFASLKELSAWIDGDKVPA